MSRASREKSASGVYHIILRGVNRQDIFFDDDDRQKMLNTIAQYLAETETILFAYCLMSNHVHLLLHNENNLDSYMKKIASSYVFYFNSKYERVGHLFQDRFRSEPVNDRAYFLTAFRYILQNPWKAGICRPDEYPWSSWASLEGKQTICDISMVLPMSGGLEELRDYVLTENDDQVMESDTQGMLSESEALRKALEIMDGINPQKMIEFPKEMRDPLIIRMKKAGISIRQISRLTGISRNIIQRV